MKQILCQIKYVFFLGNISHLLPHSRWVGNGRGQLVLRLHLFATGQQTQEKGIRCVHV